MRSRRLGRSIKRTRGLRTIDALPRPPREQTMRRVSADGAVEAQAAGMRGEEEGLKREFSLWAIFALAFAFISPIVALYGIFTFSVTTAGPAAWWGFFVVLAGQVLVAFVFAELASRWPYEGSLYQWARRLIHETYGWFTGWAYMWTLMITMTAVAYGAAGFVPIVLGIDPFTSGVQLLVAFGFVTFGTLMNMLSRTALKIFMAASIGAEVIGSLGIGTVLLLFHNEHGLGTLFDSYGAGQGPGGYLWAGFFGAVAFIGSGITKPLFGLFIIGFTASVIAIQTNCSRIMWAVARADVLPGASHLRKLSPGERLPRGTIITTFVIASILLVSTQSENLYLTLVSMATGGFYFSFALPVLGALWVRLKGRWRPAAFSLGSWGLAVAVAASIWTIFEYVNIAWPRAEGVPWYQDWAVLLMTGIVAGLGVLAYLPGRSQLRAAEDRLGEDPDAVHWDKPSSETPAPL